MALINPFPDAPWFSIDEDQYLMYLLKGYEIKCIKSVFNYQNIRFTLDGLLHREDGPAIIWEDGDAWYRLNGRYLTKEGYYKALKDGTY